jgi:flagellum-specific peptidoglycan hydrolase FlgJ
MLYRLTKTYADSQMQATALWVAAMMSASADQAKELGVSPEAIVGQVALESGWGRAAIGHNVCGIKADSSWKGPRLLQRTAEQRPDGSVYYIDAWFRDYPSFKACLDDRLEVLKRNPAFRAAGVFDAHTDLGYFEALKRGGYATDVDYASKLVAMAMSVRRFTAFMTTSDTDQGAENAPAEHRLLLIGTNGGDVETLQRQLIKKAFYLGAVDGDFGPMTRAGVIACQRAYHLAPDGVVGAKTWAALGI